MYIDNSWYGGRYILSRFCKVEEKEAFASIQHGHNLVNGKELGKRKIILTPWLVWNKKISDNCLKRGVKNVIPIGSVFLYLNKFSRLSVLKSKGTLVFPLLSQPEEKNNTNYIKLIKYLKKNFPGPYTISISVNDMMHLDKNYKNIKNVKFTSWGYRGDKNYLKKLTDNIKLHEKIVCVYPGSPIIYSLYLKKKVYLLNNFYLNNKNKQKIREIKKSLLLNLNDFKKYGLNVKNLNHKNNLSVVKKILGEEYMKTPEELIKLLGWDNKIKKILAKLLSILVNFKEDFKNGFNYSKKRRLGKDFK